MKPFGLLRFMSEVEVAPEEMSADCDGVGSFRNMFDILDDPKF